MISKNFLLKIKQKLKTTKASLEEELKKFAQEDKNLKGDWDTRFPKFNSNSSSQTMEDAVDEVEEYISKLPIEYTLETKLKDINSALEKIKKGNYGKCEKCLKPITKKRLEVCPEAKTCTKCK